MRFLDLADMPVEKLKVTSDGKYCAGWYIAYQHEDLYEDKVHYHACVWDLDRFELVHRELLTYEVDRQAGTTTGAAVADVRFTEDDGALEVLGLEGEVLATIAVPST